MHQMSDKCGSIVVLNPLKIQKNKKGSYRIELKHTLLL